MADLLPLVGPGFDPIVVDLDGDNAPEVVAGSTLGEMVVFGGDGRPKFFLRSNAAPGINANPGTILNVFEYPSAGDLTGTGTIAIFKGGIPVEAVVNLVATGQNIPFTHVVQGWDARTGQPLPGWPRATDDFQILSSPSVADVGGGPEREVIVGTGLYLLHAYGPTGVEAPGFPKFTGGWLFGTTPIADIDGDGRLEIANSTKEGHIFLWDTDAPACGGNNEWWGFRHDDYSSGFSGTDSRPPGVITELKVKSTPAAHGQEGNPGHGTGQGKGKGPEPKVHLTWTAPGDDHYCGTVKTYEIRSSAELIDSVEDWNNAAVNEDGVQPVPAGGKQQVTLTDQPSGFFYAVRSRDDVDNLSPISNSTNSTGGGTPAGLAASSARQQAPTSPEPPEASPADLALLLLGLSVFAVAMRLRKVRG